MPRPTNKTQLNEVINIQYEKLLKIIFSLNKSELEREFDFKDIKKKEEHWKRDKNLRDILIHLYEWHILLINWIEANKKGENVAFLPKPYTWKNYGEMNIMFWEKHQTTSLDKAKELFKHSHKKTLIYISSFTNEELFTKKYFSWTGTTSLGSYCISATSSHYDWAIKKLKAHIKNCKFN